MQVEEALNDDDDLKVGYLIIVVNSLGVVMVALGTIYKPLIKLVRMLTSKHVHEGTLKGYKGDKGDEEGFVNYCQRLAVSSVSEAGWTEITVKE